MFAVGKALQAIAMAVTAMALVIGLNENSMTKELTLLGVGVLMFLLGRLAESSASGG